MRQRLRSVGPSHKPQGTEPSRFAAIVAMNLTLAFCLAGCNRQKAPQPQPLINPAALNAVVWAEKRTGIYYCPNSPLFGVNAGSYMKQSKALDSGYQPQYGAYCSGRKTTAAASPRADRPSRGATRR